MRHFTVGQILLQTHPEPRCPIAVIQTQTRSSIIINVSERCHKVLKHLFSIKTSLKNVLYSCICHLYLKHDTKTRALVNKAGDNSWSRRQPKLHFMASHEKKQTSKCINLMAPPSSLSFIPQQLSRSRWKLWVREWDQNLLQGVISGFNAHSFTSGTQNLITSLFPSTSRLPLHHSPPPTSLTDIYIHYTISIQTTNDIYDSPISQLNG